jgi:hypothetical protein
LRRLSLGSALNSGSAATS